jgi:signal transduction histidine kinase
MREVIREHGLARAERLALDNDGLRSLVDELHRAREGAEAGSRAKSAFLAMMSDELRTPMVAVVGHSDRLLESDLSSDQRGELRKVKGAATLMLRLLQDLLTLSDLAGGDGRVALAAFDARGIVADAVKRFEAMANAKGLLLSVGIDAGVPASLKGDGPKLALILEHLVRNAVKFTVAGRIDVRLEVASSSDNVVSLRATVVDTGVGIPEEAQARVLGVFVQGDGSTTRSRGGVGLGLAVSSQLARLMGGSLELESVVGVGTSVRFAAPFERAVAI